MILPLKWKSAAPSLQIDSRNISTTLCVNSIFAMVIVKEMYLLPGYNHILNIEIAVFIFFNDITNFKISNFTCFTFFST